MKSRQTISPKQFSAALGVSESSIKRWCDQGVLQAVRTPGGHRRIPIETAVEFARRSGRPIARPEILGITNSGRGASLAELLPVFTRELLVGHEQSVREMAFELFLHHPSIAPVFDDVFCPALGTIGDGCMDGSIKSYEERRACAIVSGLLSEFRAKVVADPDGPLAIGGTLNSDSHRLGTQMVEIVLRNNKWRAVCLGNNCPTEVFVEAARDLRPRAMWLSTSYHPNPDEFNSRLNTLASELKTMGIPFFVGGGGQSLLKEVPAGVTVCNSLVNFLKQIGDHFGN